MEQNANQFFINPSFRDKGQRLDKWLAINLLEFSRNRIKNLILQGFVLDDDLEITSPDYKIKGEEEFVVNIPTANEDALPEPENIKLDVVYEDDDLIVINKQAGIVVHPAAGNYSATLVNALLFHCRDSLSGINGVKRPGIVHRIDKDTSGLIVAAKNDMAHNGLAEQFVVHSIKRTYNAIVFGVPKPDAGTITGNIGRSNADRKKMAIVSDFKGKTAVTHYRTLQTFYNCISLVQCNLETGRTHQIRVHLSSKGYPLVGDDVYKNSSRTIVSALPSNKKEAVLNFNRQALHAKSLGFVHPITKKELYFESPFPDDMQSLLDLLVS
jgi:23S rRNA pseudouridine1911/1915/1917 synthase